MPFSYRMLKRALSLSHSVFVLILCYAATYNTKFNTLRIMRERVENTPAPHTKMQRTTKTLFSFIQICFVRHSILYYFAQRKWSVKIIYWSLHLHLRWSHFIFFTFHSRNFHLRFFFSSVAQNIKLYLTLTYMPNQYSICSMSNDVVPPFVFYSVPNCLAPKRQNKKH